VKRLARLLLVAAFLLAQSAGIAHQAWHDGGLTAAHTGADAADGKAPKKNQLCDFHTALGSVVGALSSASPASAVDLQIPQQFVAADSHAARFSLLASRSRGPPAFL
jgi:hypothetical protein